MRCCSRLIRFPSSCSAAQQRSGFQQQYAFESRWFRTDDGVQHYVDEGSGPPLLMVHGNPTWSFAWRHLIAGLRDRYRVIAVDHLGCGFSEKPQDTSLYVLERHIARLTRWCVLWACRMWVCLVMTGVVRLGWVVRVVCRTVSVDLC